MKTESIADTISEARQRNIQFLVIDSELALTFLDLAKTTWSAEKSRRLIGEAQKACETILSFVCRLRLTPDNAPILHRNLKILVSRLGG